MLVFEDLVAAGFEVRSYKEAISVEDAVTVSGALADLHAALWRIRERLGFGDSAGKYEKMLLESLNKYRQWEKYNILIDSVEAVVPDIISAASDNDVRLG